MKGIKRFSALFLTLALTLPFLAGCRLGEGYYLTVYNWADYMDESVLDEFTAYYREIDPDFRGVTYETCDTPETMFTKFTKSGEPWDVACNSDYLEGKLLRRGDLQPFPVEQMPNYAQISDYVKEQYRVIQESAMEGYAWEGYDPDAVYGIGYMWGTMGIVYNVEDVKAAEKATGKDLFADWNLMWEPSFDHRVYMKNSVRESYIVGLLKAYTPELKEALALRDAALRRGENRETADAAYRETLSTILGRVDEVSVARAEEALKSQQSAVSVKYDVDYDKNAMAAGQASLDYCWAGDGYKALRMGAESDPRIVLSYGVPDTGTNLFFDGWFLNGKLEKDSPKYRAAVAFVDFQCAPEQAKRNMTEIGYVSATAGMDMLEWGVKNWELAVAGGRNEEGKKQPRIVWDDELVEKGNSLDVAYFFGEETVKDYVARHGGRPKLNPIQYPDAAEMYKFAVVRTYSNEENDRLLEMWSNVKTGDFPLLQIVLFGVFAAAILGLAGWHWAQKLFRRRKARKKYRPCPRI